MPGMLDEILQRVKYYVVEDIRTARRFLKFVDKKIDIDQRNFAVLNEHTTEEEIPHLLKPLEDGYDMAILSEAGLPCVADPGSKLVRLAHLAGFLVRPIPGPSSIYLALMASGFNGQNFVFHGYLPIDKNERAQKIRELELDINRNDRTQIFIETPYRNNQLLSSLLKYCSDSVLLCIASNLTAAEEMIVVKPVGRWKKELPELHKVPAVFLLYR